MQAIGNQATAPGAALQLKLETLRQRLAADVEAVADLRAVVARQSEIERLLADLERQGERVGRAAVITLVGATGAGKSTLLNALAGSRVALEGVDRPTTRRPVIYAPADADVGALTEAEVDRPQGRDSEGGPDVVRYQAGGGPWTAQILIDAPDLNSVDVQHRAAVRALAERSDVLIVVTHRQSVVEEASISFLDDFASRRRLLFVVNRVDELTPESRLELVAQVRALAAERWGAGEAPVIATSALAAQSQPNAEGWAELCSTLHQMAGESAIEGVRRLNAVGTATQLEAVFAEVREEVAADLAALPEEAAEGLEALASRAASEVAERLALRRADLAELLWGEAAKRWDGPGGWALRSGGIASIGLGAGAALATRSPWLAAGTAAGGLAADQMRRAARDQRLAGAIGLMAETGEFGAWYAESLTAARVRAARLSGDPAALAIPAAAEVRAEAAAAVDDSWSRLIDRDLPRAAEASALRFLRLPLDLPVYGLGAWTLYQVADGFAGGNYLGVDFLLNVALLGAAYLFAVRIGVRRGLGWRARGLLGDVIERARGFLGVALQTHASSVRASADRRTAALERLTALTSSWRSDIGS